MDLKNIWEEALKKFKENLSSIVFETWFSETELFDLNNNVAKIKVPTHVHKKYLKENYNDLVCEVFNEIAGSNFTFEYYTEEEIDENVKINTDEVGVPAFNFESNLNPQYTFDNFIVGKSNKFARLSAFAVAEKPGIMYNPLFLYGNSGLGKTHLMHAIGNYIVQNSKKKVLYITSDDFINDFVDLHRKSDGNNIDDVQNFKKKYRDIDVLMIDDIQYLQVADKSQEAFYHTFNELYANNKQIIISSDRSPDDLKRLEDRLKTRFNWGLTADILPPDFDLRMQIINKKIESNFMQEEFSEDVKEYIASNCSTDIRKLEGAITRVTAYAATMNEKSITLDVTVEALKDFFSKTVISKNKMDQVQQLVSQNYNVSIEDLKSKKRVANIALARQIAMYLCRTVLEESLPKIGIEFGGKNHTTVMHSVDKIKKEMKKNKEFEIEINKLVAQIK